MIDVDEFDESQLEAIPLNGMQVPCLRLTLGEAAPYHQVKVGEQAYQYEKSYPIKGYSALLPKYVKEQAEAGRRTLLIERPERFLVYLSIEN